VWTSIVVLLGLSRQRLAKSCLVRGRPQMFWHAFFSNSKAPTIPWRVFEPHNLVVFQSNYSYFMCARPMRDVSVSACAEGRRNVCVCQAWLRTVFVFRLESANGCEMELKLKIVLARECFGTSAATAKPCLVIVFGSIFPGYSAFHYANLYS